MEQSQDRLPTMEIVKDPELTAQAKKYKKLQKERMAKGREEKVEKDKLITMMHERGFKLYEDPDDDVKVNLVPGEEKLQVNIGGDKDENGSD